MDGFNDFPFIPWSNHWPKSVENTVRAEAVDQNCKAAEANNGHALIWGDFEPHCSSNLQRSSTNVFYSSCCVRPPSVVMNCVAMSFVMLVHVHRLTTIAFFLLQHCGCPM